MNILDSYKKMAYSLMIEADIDDEKMIKYRDKEGESQEMKAGSAKKLSKDHPAKIAYDTMLNMMIIKIKKMQVIS